MEHLNQDSILFDTNSDVARLNTMLDHLCERKFADPKVAISCFRKALELYGVMLPILDLENEHTMKEDDFEETFKITNVEDDTLYFYITIEKCDENHPGLYEAWAQVVEEDELDDLSDEAEDEFDAEDEIPVKSITGEIDRHSDEG